jgi:hypothetical protein
MEDFCPAVDGLGDVTVELVLEPPLSMAGRPVWAPDSLHSERGMFCVTDVDVSPDPGALTAPFRVEEAELIA